MIKLTPAEQNFIKKQLKNERRPFYFFFFEIIAAIGVNGQKGEKTRKPLDKSYNSGWKTARKSAAKQYE
ncbi:MAG: hypothetical protein KZQ64_02230 [gamma proteobacterium symbiont of Bathyaustriella thionipta]|nr:hypothetical protein [gamma proteobacterium symbiont of Bathyaustriella thionipta]MCU7952207.1 hypothetical protein [gamma proteobacterium symbiont of Bathyaustriella thionipta]MCU7955591.1 hypothetical protein [gamma proteobacterium symbiont of Bathyaustriella thionipta]